ncbi:MAG TPA: helix-turn-helix transcriptional regulator [Clostridia bacterium]|nr:helix-turn-helix transcriptional regulator [Clostridia bacterium]
MSREYIAQQLKRLREQSGLTANQVGEVVGKSGKTVNAWENNRGQPDAEILMKLCDVYNVTDILAEFDPNKSEDDIALSNHERVLVRAYRDNPELQIAVDRILNIAPSNEKAAAKGDSIADDICNTVNEINKAYQKKSVDTK